MGSGVRFPPSEQKIIIMDIFERAKEKAWSWKEQAFWEGLSVDTINEAEAILMASTEEWALAAHNEGVGHEENARQLEKQFEEWVG